MKTRIYNTEKETGTHRKKERIKTYKVKQQKNKTGEQHDKVSKNTHRAKQANSNGQENHQDPHCSGK